MKTFTVSIRNSILHTLYKGLLKPIFFLNDPETIHNHMIGFGRSLGKFKPTRQLLKVFFGYSNPILEQDILGVHFKNPIGLSAGFDKNAELIQTIPSVGFGFMEVGSITAKASDGNQKPRLWRLKKSRGLVVNFGLNNLGADFLTKRIKNIKAEIPVGTSVAMTNCVENLDKGNAIEDYRKAFEAFTNIGAYTTINISCPNTKADQPFMAPEPLDELLGVLDKVPTQKPIFVKFSPDSSYENIDRLLEILKRHRVHGIIASNLSKARGDLKLNTLDKLPPKGGISGKPIQKIADALVEHIYKKTGDRFVIIGVGGVFNAKDAYQKIRKGASLIQLITGLVFEGPQVISEINRGLVELLKRDGFKSISEAIGADARSGV